MLTISKLLGHASFVTTMIYLHVRRQHFDRSPSPIDWLPVRQCPQWAERTPDPLATTDTDQRQAMTPSEDGASELTQPPTPLEEPPSPQRRQSGRRPKKNRRRRE